MLLCVHCVKTRAHYTRPDILLELKTENILRARGRLRPDHLAEMCANRFKPFYDSRNNRILRSCGWKRGEKGVSLYFVRATVLVFSSVRGVFEK